MKNYLIVLGLALPIAAQTPTFRVGVPSIPASVTSQQVFTIVTTITASGTGWGSLHNAISVSNGTILSVAPAGSLTTKYITCALDFSCICMTAQVIVGQATNQGSGTITTGQDIETYTIKAGVSGNVTITLSGVTLSDGTGGNLAVSVGPVVTIPINPVSAVNFCDISGPYGIPDGVVDSWDTGAEMLWITNGAPTGFTWDRFGDNNPARSSQEVLTVALGGTCTATQ